MAYFSDWYKRLFKRNLLIKLIEKCSQKFKGIASDIFSREEMSRNPNLTMEIIEKYPENLVPRNEGWFYDWEWDLISVNPNMTIEIIEKYSKKPWRWDMLCGNPNITMEMVEKYSEKIFLKSLQGEFNLSSIQLSSNPNITMEIIESYPFHDWNLEMFCRNPNCSIEILQKIIKKYKKKIDLATLCTSSANIMEYLEQQYLGGNISSHEGILGSSIKSRISTDSSLTIEIIDKYFMTNSHYWYAISKNPNITMDIIDNNPDKHWKNKGISSNPNLTMEMFEKILINANILTSEVCFNPNLTMEIVEKCIQHFRKQYPKKLWDDITFFEGLSKNLTFPITFSF